VKDFKASVAVSREWDGERVGKEIVSKIRNKAPNPKFILLFATIHYKSEFKKILECIKGAFPESPLIGGTVAGFMSPDGCFTRGVAALAIDYPNMEVAVGIGHNTKQNPKKAAEECAEMIKRQIKEKQMKWKNKFLITFISGAVMPKVPGIGIVNNVKSKKLGMFLSKTGMKLAAKLGTGVGKEEDIIEYISKLFPDYYILGGSTIDEFKCKSNFQFLNNEVYINSVVAVGCFIDKDIFLNGTVGAYPTNKKFKITETVYENRIITKIENQPAKDYFFKKVLRLSEDNFKNLEAFYYKTSDYFPIGFEENKEYTTGVGAILGDNLLLGYKAKGRKAILLSVTGNEVISSIDDVFEGFDTKIYPFVFLYSSGIRLNLLADKSFLIKNKFDKYIGDIPYLAVYPLNQYLKEPNKDIVTGVYSINIFSIRGE